jgi:hypothetical protein
MNRLGVGPGGAVFALLLGIVGIALVVTGGTATALFGVFLLAWAVVILMPAGTPGRALVGFAGLLAAILAVFALLGVF